MLNIVFQEYVVSHLLDRLTFFTKKKEAFADKHGITTNESRE